MYIYIYKYLLIDKASYVQEVFLNSYDLYPHSCVALFIV